jgi:dTDP-4-amino-4,6-dideoxygalactose transaminase/predicted dehydrogenase
MAQIDSDILQRFHYASAGLHLDSVMKEISIPWFAPEFGRLEQERVSAVLASNYVNDGTVSRELERRIAELIGVKHCVAVTSGTAAISLALSASGIGPGDEVLVPDLTFVATANAARMIGAEVKLVDVEPRRFAIDVDKAVRAVGPRTRAIVPVDVNGRGADYNALQSLAGEKGLKIICDSAEALGSKYYDRSLGTFGDAACFSFSAAKTVSSGQGGMVATNSDEIHSRLRELKDQGRRHGGSGGDDVHPVMGFNFKYTNLQAAVALAQLERFEERIARFAERDAWYRELLADCPGIVVPDPPNWDGEVLQWTDVLCDDRPRLQRALLEAGIDSRAFWFPLHRQEPYKTADAEFPVAIDISARGLWLPSAFSLTRSQLEQVARVVRDTVRRHPQGNSTARQRIHGRPRGDTPVIRVGIVGCNYGRAVLVPAFRHDSRCEVVALAGADAARTAALARAANVERGFGGWEALVEEPTVAVVAIAVPPHLQPAIARRALELGKPVFLEKPLAADVAGAQIILDAARKSGRPTIIDFNFPELPSWRRAKAILDDGAIGRLQNVVVTWNFENEATRLRVQNWKTRGTGGGGLLGNFGSHCFHNLEWLCGPITGLSTRVFPLPDGTSDGSLVLALAFGSGGSGSVQMSCASFLGSGHRIELYGEEGTLVLSNPTADYFRGFELRVARHGDEALKPVSIEDTDEDPYSDSRTAAVRRLVRRFVDACENGGSPPPGVVEGYRVQCLVDAARCADATGHWVEVAPPVAAAAIVPK